MKLFDAEILAKELISQYAPTYQLGWNNLKTINGRCVYARKTIELSRHLTPLRTEQAVRQTIIHEICHALTPGNGHGRLWAAKMNSFGYLADRCSSDPVDTSSISNWKACCNYCGKVSYFIRKPRRERSCGRCSPKVFNTKYLLTFKRI